MRVTLNYLFLEVLNKRYEGLRSEYSFYKIFSKSKRGDFRVPISLRSLTRDTKRSIWSIHSPRFFKNSGRMILECRFPAVFYEEIASKGSIWSNRSLRLLQEIMRGWGTFRLIIPVRSSNKIIRKSPFKVFILLPRNHEGDLGVPISARSLRTNLRKI